MKRQAAALEEIHAKLRLPEVPAISRVLSPLRFDHELSDYALRFVDGTRQWLFDDIEAWRQDPSTSRCRVLLAGPGFGKTAIMAQLVARQRQRKKCLAVHLCRHDEEEKRNPRRTCKQSDLFRRQYVYIASSPDELKLTHVQTKFTALHRHDPIVGVPGEFSA